MIRVIKCSTLLLVVLSMICVSIAKLGGLSLVIIFPLYIFLLAVLLFTHSHCIVSGMATGYL